MRKPVLADFSNLPSTPKFGAVSAIGRLVVDDFIKGDVDEVFWSIPISSAWPARSPM